MPLAERPAPADWYTGTLYKALDAPGWDAAERAWALAHLLVHDKDAGIVSAGSWEPLSLGPLSERSESKGAGRDHPLLGPLSERSESKGAETLLLDARSGEYVRLIRPPASAFTLRVVSEGDDGRRLAISHWNKLHKGVLARALIRDRPDVGGLAELLAWAAAAGIRLEQTGDRSLDLLV